MASKIVRLHTYADGTPIDPHVGASLLRQPRYR